MSIDTKALDTATEAILEHVMSGRSLDPELYRRIKEEGAKITDSIRKKHGVQNIVVELVRESRDEGATHISAVT
jgi:hypothetical protein